MSAVGAELSPDAADPGLNLDGVLLAFDEGCRSLIRKLNLKRAGVGIVEGPAMMKVGA